jgi:hypothetical protein
MPVEVVTSARVGDGTASVRAHAPSRIDRAYDHHNVLYKAQYSMYIDNFVQGMVGPKQRGPSKQDPIGIDNDGLEDIVIFKAVRHLPRTARYQITSGVMHDGAFRLEAGKGWDLAS